MRKVQIEVAYATLEEQILKIVEVDSNATVFDAINQSGLLEKFSLDKETLQVGIFSRKVTLDSPLEPFDRVEIYRPLLINPKEARRLREGRGR